jgi:hypothetical protein
MRYDNRKDTDVCQLTPLKLREMVSPQNVLYLDTRKRLRPFHDR